MTEIKDNPPNAVSSKKGQSEFVLNTDSQSNSIKACAMACTPPWIIAFYFWLNVYIVIFPPDFVYPRKDISILILYLPLALTFTFGPIMTSYLAFNAIKTGIKYEGSVLGITPLEEAALWSFVSHFICLVLFFIVLLAIDTGRGYEAGIADTLGWSGWIGLFNLILYIFVTLPLALLCATIFKSVGMKKIS